MRSRWGTDPRFYGSYSYPGPGAGGEEAEALAAPLMLRPPPPPLHGAATTAAAAATVATATTAASNENFHGARPVVCFAGEHTSRQHMGTVHGAMESGRREAARLLAAFSGGPPTREGGRAGGRAACV